MEHTRALFFSTLILAILLITIASPFSATIQNSFAQENEEWLDITSASIEQEVIQREIGCSDACPNNANLDNTGRVFAELSLSGSGNGFYITSASIEQEARAI